MPVYTPEVLTCLGRARRELCLFRHGMTGSRKRDAVMWAACLLMGHDDMLVREPGRLWLRCKDCGRDTPGGAWVVTQQRRHSASDNRRRVTKHARREAESFRVNIESNASASCPPCAVMLSRARARNWSIAQLLWQPR